MSKRTMPISSSSSSTRPSSSMATFFPDRVKSRHSGSGHSQSNGHGHVHRSHSSSLPKVNYHFNASNSGSQGPESRWDSSSLPLDKGLPPRPSRDPKLPSIPVNGESDSRPKYRSYQVIYDPELSKSKSKGSRAIHRYNGADAPTPTDPRCEGQKRYTRTSKGKKALTTALPIPRFPHDSNTVIPPPTTQLLIYGLSTLTKKVSLLSRFEVFGKVKYLDVLQDPGSGASLGMCHLKFQGSLAESHQAALRLIENANTINIDMKTPRIRFDEAGSKAKKLMENILVRKSQPSERPPPRQPESFRSPREERERSRSRSRSPGRSSKTISQYNSPTLFLEYGTSLPYSTKPRHLRPCLERFDYYKIYSDTRGIYVIFDSIREAQLCYDQRQGIRLTELRINLDMELFLHGMDHRSERRDFHEPVRNGYSDLQKERERGSYRSSHRDSRDSPRDSYKDVHKESQRDSLPLRPRINPVKEACDHIVAELQSLLIKDIKERASAPAIYEYLHPNRFKDVSSDNRILPTEKIPSSTVAIQEKTSAETTEVSISENKINRLSNAAPVPALPRFKKRQSHDLSPLASKVRATKPKSVVRPMNHRLNYSSSDNESEASSQMSTPLPSTADSHPSRKSEDTRKRSLLRERDFDYTSSEDEESTEVETSHLAKKIKLEKPRETREQTPDSTMVSKDATPVTTPRKTPTKRQLPVTPTSAKKESFVKTETSPAAVLVKKPEPTSPVLKEEVSQQQPDDEQATSKVWRPADHEQSLDILNPKLNWASVTSEPKPVCDDNMDTLLDLDGFQSFIKDDEDWQLMKKALSSVKPQSIENPLFWAWNKKETKSINNGGQVGPTIISPDVDEKLRWMSSTGASRSQGWFKIPEADKAAYLPHRKKIHKPIDTIQFEGNKDHNAAVLSSRMNRVNNRRLQADISLQKQMLSSETDILRFNQLKKRKKPVKFARSAIHNWGLYAIEPIAANEMIIEYVGEIIRQKVAERREKNYLRSGIGSSYLFRIDEATVIDATKRGGIARFINHCCTPSCTAKIIKVEGQKRIVIYALRDIAADEELTYDYKFEREQNGEERIPCLCGAPGCKGFLN